MDPTRNSIKCANLEKKNATKTLAMIRQAFGEESMGRTRIDKTYRGRKKARQAKRKLKRMLLILFDIKEILS
jgi:hypothetical protein